MLNEIISGGAGALACGGYALYGTFAPTSSFWGKVVWRGVDRSRPRVSVTFDDGPTGGCTEPILDLLGEMGVRGAFFVIGRNARRWPDLVARMDREGHLVGNHSFDHGHFDLFRGWGYWREQVEKTNEVIGEIIGKRPRLFRPAMGITTWPIAAAARGAGQTAVTWSRRGWDGVGGEAGLIVKRIARGAGAGDIVMLHDGIDPHLRGAPDRKATIAALPGLVRELRGRGLEAVRLDELLGVEAYAEGMAARVARTVR